MIVLLIVAGVLAAVAVVALVGAAMVAGARVLEPVLAAVAASRAPLAD